LHLVSRPQTHHATLRIGKKRKLAHAGHRLLLDIDLSSFRHNALAVGCEVIHVDVHGHIAGPRLGALRFQNATVDAARTSSLDQTVIHLGHMLDLPSENFLVEACYFGRLLRHKFPMNSRSTHEISFRRWRMYAWSLQRLWLGFTFAAGRVRAVDHRAGEDLPTTGRPHTQGP